ncbi:MAG: galactokinase, partial [Pyrinomonadaceae bacterium]
LRNNYEVSCRELDLLVTIAGNKPEVLGARMTGGGFGGSTVNLVTRENLDKVIAEIASEYESATNIKTDIYISDAADGASEFTNGNS